MPPVILVRLEGGLGNQMFQYSAGKAAATATGRHLLLDPSAISRGLSGRAYELPSFLIDGQCASLADRLMSRAQVGQRLPAAARVIARVFSSRRWRLLRDQGATFDERLFTPGGDLVLEGFWQSAAYAQCGPAVATQLRREFALREPMPNRLATIQAEIAACEAVGVHVRRGDYVTNPTASAYHGVLPLTYYAAAADYIVAQLVSPKFFVFSDDLPWSKAHLRLPANPVCRCCRRALACRRAAPHGLLPPLRDCQ